MHAPMLLVSFLMSTSTPDAWITTKTKLALFTTAGVSSTTVSVDTVDGMVTLYGKVGSEDERTRADTEAKKIDGVKTVRNLLQVVSDSHQGVVNANDKELKDKAELALKADKSLDKSSINVQSVDNGVLLLSGHAHSLTDHLRAVETAYSVTGIRAVRSEIQSPNELADREIWRERGVDPAAESFSDGADDIWITSEAKLRLIADSKVPALDVSIDTRARIVTLFGVVDNDEAKRAAEADIRKIKAVREIRNELQVVANPRKETVAERDTDMKKAIEAVIKKADIKHVSVDIKNGVVRLTGTVKSGWDRVYVATLTRATHGVRSVDDDLRIEKH